MDILDTGDILLFQGSTYNGSIPIRIINWVIEKFTNSKYSHTAIVIRDPKFSPEPLQGLYILESTGLEDVKDVEDNQIKFGVQLRNLDEVINNYNGNIYYRKLHCQRDQTFYKKLRNAHSVLHNRPYDDGFDYIKALFNWHIGKIQKQKTFFCSALVSYVYVCWDFLPSDTPWSIVTPKDLGEEGGKIKLKWKNCKLESPVELKN